MSGLRKRTPGQRGQKNNPAPNTFFDDHIPNLDVQFTPKEKKDIMMWQKMATEPKPPNWRKKTDFSYHGNFPGSRALEKFDKDHLESIITKDLIDLSQKHKKNEEDVRKKYKNKKEQKKKKKKKHGEKNRQNRQNKKKNKKKHQKIYTGTITVRTWDHHYHSLHHH